MAPILRNRIPVSSIRKQLNLFFMISTSLVIPVTSSIFMDESGRDCVFTHRFTRIVVLNCFYRDCLLHSVFAVPPLKVIS